MLFLIFHLSGRMLYNVNMKYIYNMTSTQTTRQQWWRAHMLTILRICKQKSIVCGRPMDWSVL